MSVNSNGLYPPSYIYYLVYWVWKDIYLKKKNTLLFLFFLMIHVRIWSSTVYLIWSSFKHFNNREESTVFADINIKWC